LNLLEQIEQLGFAILPNVVGAQKMSLFIDELNAAKILRSRAGARHLLRYECVADLAKNCELLSVARETLGDGTATFRSTLFAKSPNSNWLVTWHQDTALPLREKLDRPGSGHGP
jgi:hypothetical protein